MDLHPFFIHFPISLYFIAFLFEVLKLKFDWIHENTPLLIFILATLFSIPSSFTGDSAKILIRDTTGIIELLNNHENMGTFVTVSGLIFSILLVYLKLKFPSKKIFKLRISIYFLLTLMVFYTGFLGAKLVHGFGITAQKKVEKID